VIGRLTAILVVMAGGTFLGVAPSTASNDAMCNGRAAQCDRSLGEVAFATTHNSMASRANGFRPPNQRRSIREQLRHGIRGFQIDAYPGTLRKERVYTDLSGPLGDATEFPPRLVAAANAIHAALGAPPPGTPTDVYLCHVFCELGAVPMLREMRTVRTFLDHHPREVLVMVIEDYVAPERLAAILREAGLESMLLAVEPGAALPTLGEMITSGKRLSVSLERGDGGPTLPNAFAGLVQETPFTFRRPPDLEAASSCAANRGLAGSPIFQFNHWVTPAEPVTARRVNSSLLRERLRRCTAERARGPTLVAVDFAEQGDLLHVVDDLNEHGGASS
jgi:hypothetical protein